MALQTISQFFSHSFLNESSLTSTLGEEFVLCDNGNMVFHWADYHETCDLIQEQLEKNTDLREDLKQRENALKRLSLIPVWVRTENKIHQTTMHELYEKFILNQSHLLGGVDPFCPLQISFISGTGPFKGMSVAECFNNNTYRDFVLVYLLQGKLPKRDFRVRVKSKVLMEYGRDFEQAELICLEQITMNGLLLSMDSETYMNKIAGQEFTRLLINSKVLSEGKGKNLKELRSYLSQFAFNFLYSANKNDSVTCSLKDFSIQSAFDFAKNKKVYLFISHDKLGETHPASVKVIRDFVTYAKDLIRDHYQNDVKKKSA